MTIIVLNSALNEFQLALLHCEIFIQMHICMYVCVYIVHQQYTIACGSLYAQVQVEGSLVTRNRYKNCITLSNEGCQWGTCHAVT